MSFAVTDFVDLVRLLEQHPEWRAELRRLVLTDEVLALPQAIHSLTEAQRRTDEQLAILTQRVDSLTEAQRRTDEQLAILTQRVDALTQQVDALTQRVDALTQRVDSLTQRVDALTQQVDALTQRVDSLAEQMAALGRRMDSLAQDMQLMVKRVDSLGQDVGDLKGIGLEFRYQRLAYAYFQRLLRRIHVLSPDELSTLLEDAVDEGKLSYPDMEEIIRADLVVRGQRREDRAEAYLVVELSWGVGPGDVERAARRAKLLAQLGTPTIPVAAGKAITAEAAELARRLEAWLVMDERALSPSEST